MQAFCCLLVVITLCTFFSCSKPLPEKEEKKLVRVGKEYLYNNDIDDLIKGLSKSDSAQFTQEFAESWARERVLMQTAERNLPPDLNIERLVQDYRNSLILQQYKEVLVRQRLDSTITTNEVLKYYNANTSKYELTEDIMRCYFVKINKNVPNIDSLFKWWEEKKHLDYDKLANLCNKYADKFILDEKSWTPVRKVKELFPNQQFNKAYLTNNKTLQKTSGKYIYLLKVFEYISEKKDAPLEHVQDDIENIILYKRKVELIDKIKEEIYQEQVEKNNIEYF